jgi:hypothetical protein
MLYPTPSFFLLVPLTTHVGDGTVLYQNQTTAVSFLDDNKLFRWATNAIDLRTLDGHPDAAVDGPRRREAACSHYAFGRRKQQTVPTTQDFTHRTCASVKPPWGVGVVDGPPEAGTRWKAQRVQRARCFPSLNVANTKRPYVASADNAIKLFCALFRQI